MYKKLRIKIVCLFVLFGLTQISTAQNNNDMTWLLNQIKQHPDIMNARAQLESSRFSATFNQQPLYNPTLESDYEREGSNNNYSVGLSQTFDRNNKQATLKDIAQSQSTIAEFDYQLALLNKVSQALQAINNYQAITKQNTLLLQQEKQLEKLLVLVKQRVNSGDLGQLDAELAYLSLSQGFGQSATVEAELKNSEAQLSELLGNWQQQNLAHFSLSDYQMKPSDALIKNHPNVKSAYAQWQQAQSQAELAKKNKKNDPSFGITAGKVANDNLMSLSFSIPLNLRRNFDSAYLAANQQVMAAESNYLAAKRQQKFSIKASLDSLNAFENRYKKWQNLMQGREGDLENLLQKQWQLGDISTTNYLLTLQQRTQGLLAGIELEQHYKSAIINYLTATAQLGSKTVLNEVSP
jgi:outer membrane protein TolC